MEKQDHLIYGVHITDRLHKATDVQKILTEYGCHVKTRIGLHEVSDEFCAPNGLLILEMFGDEGKCREAFDKLNALEGVEAKDIRFSHPA